MLNLTFDNQFTNLLPGDSETGARQRQLSQAIFARVAPKPAARPLLMHCSREVAAMLGLSEAQCQSDEFVQAFSGSRVLPGMDPHATCYGGHQFGNWAGQLGDGRAILLGEIVGKDKQRYDLQLKGSGQTPYSRMGDGRSPLGPVMREYVVSEAMAALGVPTSRSLAAVQTGEDVYRDQAMPGAVLARVAKSHIRIGTFQFFASKGDKEALRLLVDHVLERHYPNTVDASTSLGNKALLLIDEVMKAQAKLVAGWQMVGFIHGVMNTDNVLLSGETVDYGPCAFMDTFKAGTVFSSIDHGGRYAYNNQPNIAHWNMACLAQALVPVINEKEEKAIEIAKSKLDDFPTYFLTEYVSGMRRKLGLIDSNTGDETLATDFLDLLEAEQLDFTLSFRLLSELSGYEPESSVKSLTGFSSAFDKWMIRWKTRCDAENNPTRQERMLSKNPAMIPRNHLIEESIIAASTEGNFDLFNELVENLSTPFDIKGVNKRFLKKPKPEEMVRQTFCGT